MIKDILHPLFLKQKHISTDTRSIIKESIFFALKGENFDGNKFAELALKNGASYVVIDNLKYKLDERFILVDDVLDTLQQLAVFHREYLNIPILALTGSNGKTTTKELVNSVLKQKFNTVATKGNLNNHIGVPLTLLSMDETTEFGIVEMGANHPNEIDFLCSLAKPNFGLVTNFGKAHLEGFGSFEGVIEAKSELYRFLEKDNGLVFIQANDAIQIKQTKNNKVFRYSNNPLIKSDVLIELLNTTPFVSIKVNHTKIHSKLIGNYNFNNIAFSVAIGTYFNISDNKMKHAIEAYQPDNNRSQIINTKQFSIILDAYNANPTSMQSALDNFNNLKSTYKIAILGDMFELGDFAKLEHQNIIDYIKKLDLDTVYVIGNNFFQTKFNKSSNIKKYTDYKSFKENFKIDSAEASVLIKGSRGMALERVLDLLQ